MTNATVLPLFVLYGKDQDVAIREFDPKYDPTNPNMQFPGHALFAFTRSRQPELKQILDLLAPPAPIADGTEGTCKQLATERIGNSFPDGKWRAGSAYIVGRKVDEEGHWIPLMQAAALGDDFAFSFHLQKQNMDGVWENYMMILQAREGTFLEARVLVHVQKAD